MSRMYFELGKEKDALRLAITTSELLAAVATLSVCYQLLPQQRDQGMFEI